MAAARQISLQRRLGYIDSDMIVLGILAETAVRGNVIPAADCDFVADKVCSNLKALPSGAKATMHVPLTKHAEIVLKQAMALQPRMGEPELDECMVLLISLQSDVGATHWLKNRGWVFQNVCERLQATGLAETARLTAIPPPPPVTAPPRPTLLQRLPLLKIRQVRRYINAANLCQLLRDYEGMRTWSAGAWKLQPRNLSCGYYHAAACFLQKDYTACLALTDKLLQRHPDAVDVHVLKAASLVGMQCHDEAIESYKAAAGLGYNPADANNDIGYNEAGRGDFSAAVRNYEEALRVNPEHAFAHNNKGFALYRLGKTEDGIRSIRHSLTLDRGNAYAWRNLAVIAHETGDKATAKSHADKAFLYHYRRDFGDDLDILLRS